MECKANTPVPEITEQKSINRNILECKAFSDYSSFPGNKVLIETYWNVKYEPYFNQSLTLCINRNILECKAMQGKEDAREVQSINRNILECKVFSEVISA